MIRAAAIAMSLAGPVAAAECRLALVLAMDVSSSVDMAEDSLQRGGLAAALLAPPVQDAFFASPLPVAIAVYEWSGRYNQELLVDWTLIETPAHLRGVARTIGKSSRSHNEFPTAMGYALAYGAGLFQRGPDCLFRTLDMAGDGENNEGFPPAAAYREFAFSDVTVNGLVVNAADYEAEVTLVDFYRTEVLHGPGAFLEIAQGFDDYARAIRAKLIREVTPKAIGARSFEAEDPKG
ncbi:DUF1194 domain-containing protein [Thalassococcus sp. S3]|uniref:DUF1194 domain-containing protein n=1 Tax=Thalassococcus sp. S3 TaxID=2017482 RepID=UPI0010244945|nr:DUF1194 domain-containing protein [Thalassococcus sp. S3]QBF32807.1 hypothetical protein CFI11_16510 [Thalassococcus sp. S3]